jgi:hypothetical protein
VNILRQLVFPLSQTHHCDTFEVLRELMKPAMKKSQDRITQINGLR